MLAVIPIQDVILSKAASECYSFGHRDRGGVNGDQTIGVAYRPPGTAALSREFLPDVFGHTRQQFVQVEGLVEAGAGASGH
jgi:hypothetical protein